jgi:hypothetical protein
VFYFQFDIIFALSFVICSIFVIFNSLCRLFVVPYCITTATQLTTHLP